MKKLFLPVICLLLFSFTGVETKSLQYKSGARHCDAEVRNGMFNGKYTSWYQNGVKKAEGNFNNNQMTGEWSFWDSTGTLRMTRLYENNFQFKTITMVNATGKSITETAVHPSLTRNNAGYYNYSEMQPGNIQVSKRLWRMIGENNTNSALFKNGTVFTTLLQNVKSGSITAYDPATDEMKLALDAATFNKKTGTTLYYVTGYKIKEDWYFNNKTQTGEYRIAGICPVVESSQNREPSDLFWVDYSSARSLLAALPLEKSVDPQISNIDDLLFFRKFSSSIYKESNIYNKSIADYATGDAADRESDRIELDRVELEINSLLQLCNQ